MPGAARFLGGTLTAPKGLGSPSPGHRPGDAGPMDPASSAQRANRSANAWPVGPIDGQNALRSPGRCPGLGERPGLWPAEPLPRNLAAPDERQTSNDIDTVGTDVSSLSYFVSVAERAGWPDCRLSLRESSVDSSLLSRSERRQKAFRNRNSLGLFA